MSKEASREATAGRQLALNLSAALRVAGPRRENGKPGPLRSVDVQRNTGIARSTLRTLKSAEVEHDPNPDLRTLNRLATMLGIPIAFLLMRPEDWNAIRMAVDGIRDPLEAAHRLGEADYFGTDYIEKMLRACGVHPDRPPIGDYKDSQELDRMAARNEWRRRTSQVMAALTRPASRERASQDMLAAFVASFVNQATPSDPSRL